MKGTSGMRILIAASNGEIGGGEIMQLALAQELTTLGHSVQIIAPESPSALLRAARAQGTETVGITAKSRKGYMLALGRWARQQNYDLFWCNGLVPAFATIGVRRRVVHLHSMLDGHKRAVAWLARLGTLKTIVPSHYMAKKIPGTEVLGNWSPSFEAARREKNSDEPFTLGFLGRPSVAKGTVILAQALQGLEREAPGKHHLVIAGEPRFVDKESWQAVQKALDGARDQVSMAGWINPADFFNQIDVLVCHSLAPEPFGLVVTEAMSAKVPVIVSDAGALPELVGNKHPWIAAAGDVDSLIAVIKQVQNQDHNQTVIDAAHQRWQELWSPEAGRVRLAKLINDLAVQRIENI